MAPKKTKDAAAATPAAATAAAATPAQAKSAPAPVATAAPKAAPAAAAPAKVADKPDVKSAPATAAAGGSNKRKAENIHHKLPMSDKKRWFIFYPAYINARLTTFQGRRLAVKDCAERPTVLDLAEICKAAKLPFEIENKCYSRDFHQIGRVRVQLLSDDRKPLRTDLATRKQFMKYAAAQIATLKGRAPAAITSAAEMDEPVEADAVVAPGGGGRRKGGKHGRKK